jgi:8-oxo-dGTP pyrophosphatase MutT (NUDIX family)
MPNSIACSMRWTSLAEASRAELAAMPWKTRIIERLTGTAPSIDPDREARAWLPAPVAEEWFKAPLVPAAVLVPLIERPSALSLVLTRRTEHLRDHPGQISFPGGRMEPEDDGPQATALREAAEELGIAAGLVDVAGYLPAHPVITGFAITPVVGFLAGNVEFRPDPFEVAETIEVPLDFLLDSRNRRTIHRSVRGFEVPLYEYHYRGHRIWGATGNIIQSLILAIE